jgi:UDP-N-acetylmuramoylalanine--D-glutamate ligase
VIPDAWRGREAAVVGLARSGRAAGLLLRSLGERVYASDAAASAPLEETAGELRRAGCEVQLGGHDLARIGRAGVVVLSPGVPPEAPPCRAAREAGVPIVSELDLGARMLPATRLICVTGSNGKTTTTALAAHLLRATGLGDADAAGNIGNPLCQVAMRERAPAWLAVECSSFQLHDCPSLAPGAGVLTNLSPNHLDRYPSLDAYYGDKRLLFRNARADSRWVVNGDDAAVLALCSGVAGRLEPFSLETRLAAGTLDRAAGWLVLRGTPLVRRAEFPLAGDHNVQNALAAALALPPEADRAGLAEGLRTFRALEHRLEPVREVGGVRWINDSKSTSVAATVVALRSMDRPFVLLLGGRHKGAPYTDLRPLLAHARAVIAYGEAGPEVEKDLAGAAPLERGGDFDDVVARARRLARPGDAVLLSPACSSYDMFDNYEQRGRTFKRLVEAL